ncbi:hypothetical protein PHY01_00180 [Pseudonocardia hydrocarbonoxydans]|uniref:GH16 domain-containing protein n=1 Tax=Pseudonocardia hydrocarbonoxydans TaxID=76726 RepID=A0A4Y3WGC5_9PSEU|nr:hypothetical protein PHY01_00180 [Pseudonocardia hydrocarbonoxydans]
MTVGGLVALALLSGSVVAYAAQPAPAECAPAAAGPPADGAAEGLVPAPRAAGDDEPDDGDDEPDDDGDGGGDDDGDGDDGDGDDGDGDDGDGDDGDGGGDDDGGDEDGGSDEDPDDSDGGGGDEPGADEPDAGDTGSDDTASDDPPSDDDVDEAGGQDADPADDPAPGEDSSTADDPTTGDDAATGDDPTTGDDPSTVEDPASGPADDASTEEACATAAETLGWGEPTLADEFDGPLGGDWRVYSGTGFDGQGTRTAEALRVDDGVLTITGDPAGATGGMAWSQGQEYGRWEARVRIPEGDPSYHAVALLWPDDPAAAGPQIDFMEVSDPGRGTTGAFVHPGAGAAPAGAEVEVDGTAWHTWAVEWTPTSVTTYLDGAQWWRVDDPAVIPSGPMHLCLQLDWFPTGEGEVRESSMQVDWVRQYALPDTAAGEPGDRVGPADVTEGAPTARLAEGAPDLPVREGPVPRPLGGS